MEYRIDRSVLFVFFLSFCLVSPLFVSAQIVDSDGDSLSDVWEHRFSAFDLNPGDDTDFDGHTNLIESQAGTNPFDSLDFPQFKGVQLNPDFGNFHFEFPTAIGKRYQLQSTENLGSFLPFGPHILGNGGLSSIILKADDHSSGPASILQHFWNNIESNDIEELTELSGFPNRPDGRLAISRFEVPTMAATGFGGSLIALITPEHTGDYSFFISSGSSAELWLSSDASDENVTKIAEVLSGQIDIQPNQWTLYASQRSSTIQLVAGDSYFLRVNYLGHQPDSHCQIGWIVPGSDEISIIEQNSLSRLPFTSAVIEGQTLFAHDYDSPDQDVVWPANTQKITGGNAIDGSSEHIFGDPGSNVDESVDLPVESTDHLYASWRFRSLENHDTISFVFRAIEGGQDGPRVKIEERNNFSSLEILAGGTGGNDYRTEIEVGEVYRVEVVASLQSQFTYQAGLFEYTVQPQTFDIYITDESGDLIGSARGLSFREPDVLSFQRFRILAPADPNLVVDSFLITDGSIDGSGYILTNQEKASFDSDKQFFTLSVLDQDQDGDGISDWEEQALASELSLLFFDPETTPGINDSTAIINALSSSPQGGIEVSLVASDTVAFEDNSPNIDDDNAAIIVSRTGSLEPVTVELCVTPLENTGNTMTVCDGSCCSLTGSAGDEEAELEDYVIIDEDGLTITNQVSFDFGETSKVLTIKAVKDEINEYPETLNLAVKESPDDRYEISETLNGASIQLIDLPDSPANNAVFTGLYSQDGSAVVPTNGSGSTTAILNGPRTKLYITTEFSGLTSNQQDAHIHKSNVGPAPGPIIYAITNVPGAETSDPPDSDPLNGPLENYPWDLSESSGAVPVSGGPASKQTIIDSLFGQNGETPLYLNVHTVSNPAGEIWSFLNITGGSIVSPGDPTPGAAPGSAAYPQLTGDALESEVRRFLNQATFGATEIDVNGLLANIASARSSDPTYHRHDAFDSWLDSQMGLPQTYLLDYLIATNHQHMDLAGYFDPAANPSNTEFQTPQRPATWASVNRSTNPDPALWHLNAPYPVNEQHRLLQVFNGLAFFPGNNGRRQAHWQMMVNADDQLRQKTGFALQQIVVVSDSLDTVRRSANAAANYQDLLNHYAFFHYRDVLGFVNWSPLMAKWLSSLQNQKGIDLDGDGKDDTSPDENLARENMQLFSIGLFDVWHDGTLRLGADGAPNNTYTNEDIRQFAKVLTGQSFSVTNNSDEQWGGVPYNSIPKNTIFNASTNFGLTVFQRYNYPMKMFGEFHDLSIKNFAGTTVDNTHLTDPTAQGIADLEQALNWLAGNPGDGNPDFDGVNSHNSTPAFICHRLIQRFTTSNPSRDYLHRVATVFANSEGDLGLTIKAILLDPEARVPDLDSNFGMKKSPMEALIQIVRSLGGFTHVPMVRPTGETIYDDAVGDLTTDFLDLRNYGYPQQQVDNQSVNTRFLFRDTVTDGSEGLQMNPLGQETVFNWYLPDFAPSGPISDAGLVAPEMQLVNEQDVIRNINFQRTLVFSALNGIDVGGVAESQNLAFGGVSGTENNDRIRIDITALTLDLYPSVEPTPTATETSEFLASVELVDNLDRILNCGFMKQRYPYDASDDDDPNTPGEDDLLKNPREIIIDSITYGSDPYNGVNDQIQREGRMLDALYLIVSSPEFQVRK